MMVPPRYGWKRLVRQYGGPSCESGVCGQRPKATDRHVVNVLHGESAMRRLVITSSILSVAILVAVANAAAQDRATKVRQDRERFGNDARWVYNRLDLALETARASGKPILVVFRCIPCEACSQFDQQVMTRQNEVQDLLDKFVCVRIVQTNGLDLSLFQFDYDQSFHAMLLNADQVIYARFGTRSSRPEDEDMQMSGLRATLERVLAWHAAYPGNRDQFAGKTGQPAAVRVPEEFPTLKGKYGPKLDYDGRVVESCIHCHQVREAERLTYRGRGEAMPERVLFPFPLPDVVGLRLDARNCATVADVAAGSIADRAGLRAGDEILELDGQPLASPADVQWVLHQADSQDRLPVRFRRNGEAGSAELRLDAGWRRRADISFRPTTWDLRRMVTGGLVLEDLTDAERKTLNLPTDSLALRVKYVGQYGDHAVGKRAGFEQGDIIVAVDDQRQRRTESEWIDYALSKPAGSVLAMVVRRAANEKSLAFATQ